MIVSLLILILVNELKVDAKFVMDYYDDEEEEYPTSKEEEREEEKEGRDENVKSELNIFSFTSLSFILQIKLASKMIFNKFLLKQKYLIFLCFC
jgi:hypothetical protein